MDMSVEDIKSDDSHPQEVLNAVGDSFISPYNSPDRNLNPHHPNGTGDYSTTSMKSGRENQQFLANRISDGNVELLSLHSKTDCSLENKFYEHEQKKVSENRGEEISEDLDNGAQNNGGNAVTSPIQLDQIKGFETNRAIIPGVRNHKIENAVQDDGLTQELSVIGVAGEQALAELLASTTETTPTDEMTQSEMVSVSKKMEEEFRSMLVMEQQRKKQRMEGSPHYVAKEVNKTETNLPECQTPNPGVKKQHKHFPRPKIYSSKSSQHTLAVKQTSRSSAKPTRGRLSSPPRTTPATLRVISKTTNFGSESSKSPHSAIVGYKPETPTTERNRKIPNKVTPTTLSSALSATPLTARKPISTLSRMPKSAPISSQTPLVSPKAQYFQSLADRKITYKMPDTKNVHSKIGSMQSTKHTLGGGKVKMENKKTDYSQVLSKIGSKANLGHTPQGGRIIIENRKLDFNNVQSRCGSMSNMKHTPGGGKVKIEHKKVDVSKVSSKCGSRDNITHTPGGGKTKVETKKLDYSHISSKCGSKDNLKHIAQGGKVKIFNKKTDFTEVTGKIGSMENMSHSPGGGKVKIYHGKVDLSSVRSNVGSKDNITHIPGGGKVQIVNRSLDLSQVKSKCGSLDNASHHPGGGDIRIFDEKLELKQAAKSKIGSLENAHHVPGGGDVQIYDEKVHFSESATPRTDTGFNGVVNTESAASGSSSSM